MLAQSFERSPTCRIARLDLRDNNVRVEGGKALAALIGGMPSLTALDLSANRLCGVSVDARTKKRVGNYSGEAVLSLAAAVGSGGSLCELKLGDNCVDEEGKAALERAKGAGLKLWL